VGIEMGENMVNERGLDEEFLGCDKWVVEGCC
jgi:hypothetical protein